MSEDRTQRLPDDGVRLILSRLDSVDTRATSIEQGITRLGERITKIEERLTKLEERVSALEGRMTALEEKVDRRLQETRPIWEQVLSRLGGIESRLEVLEGMSKSSGVNSAPTSRTKSSVRISRTI